MEKSLSIDDYLAIAKRRVWYAVVPFLAILAIAVTVINSLPPVYRSTATVSVESQQIPDTLVQSTVIGFADERIGFVQQRVMTSARLLGIAKKFNLFPELQAEAPDSAVVTKLRRHIFLETIRDRSINRRDASNTVAFTLSFEHRDPQVAAAVANELVTMFLAENVKNRTDRATETTEFLKRESARLSGQVAAIEARIAAYKQKHGEALPEHLQMRMNMLESSENFLKDLEREISTLEENKRLLEAQRTTVGAILAAGGPSEIQALSPAQQLAALRVELTQKSAIYARAHPDIKSLERRVSQLAREVAEGPVDTGAQTPPALLDPARTQVESQIASVDVQISSLKTQKTTLQTKIEALQAKIIETPQVERGLKDLSRDYDTAVTEYEEISAKQRAAQLAESLESEEKADRFVLLEPPLVPSLPVRPEKLKLYAMSVVGAGGAGAGAAFLAEFLDTTVRGPAMLTAILQQHPLGVIPLIEHARDRRRKRLRRYLFVLATMILVSLALLAAHLWYQPLPVLWQSVVH